MKISIITLTYNNTEYLEETIKSVFSQEIDKEYYIEYLIVDDCSLLFPEKRIKNYINKYSSNNIQARIIRNDINVGTVRSFNKAIKESIGDIIVPLSADDIFYDNMSLKKIIEVFANTTVNIATGCSIIVTQEEGKKIGELPPRNKHFLFKNQNEFELLKYLCLRGNIITGAATYYRKKFLEEYGYFDENYALLEDYPFYIKVLGDGEHIQLIEEYLVKYRQGGVSTNKKKLNIKLENDFNKLTKELLTKEYLTEFQKKLIYYKRFVNKKNKLSIHGFLKYPCETLFYLWLKIKSIILT
ncbi:TPA: glycosyltransferase [Escherichia coli]|nr:glycosyltransferase [Escherichia coli]